MTSSLPVIDERLLEQLINFRRNLHEFPEVSGEEYDTSQKIQDQLTQYGIPFRAGYAKTGVLGIIKGGKPGPTVALRADIDALPITEKTNLTFSSKKEGKMHACGHDAHTTMLLGAGILLNERKDELSGTVLLIFQPAEEASPKGGAQPMMDEGVFAEFEPDVIFGQHVWPDLPVGQIGIRDKEMMGATDRFKVVIKGAGGHASMPHQTNDAIIAANHVVTMLQTIVSRNINPIDAAVVTIGRIEGGYRYNVIADSVSLEGSIRTYKKQVKEVVKKRFYEVVENASKAMGATAQIDYIDGYEATINTPEWAEVVRGCAQQALDSNTATPNVDPSLGGEDFSRFLHKYPGAFFWLGSAIEGRDIQKPLHDPNFEFNEKALPIGVKMLVDVTEKALEKLQNEK
ncbi:M20 metallopeptidase family protein [Sutcliffiella horikoshii]|uniref:M20 metallopeptidase family protein n=1 Tax=Sutcliffiella horikoshii TaxID=79883 RepID=UPI001F2709B7|nr:M20 family metallopeptidase [Sutcliffiella horikoshii]MCG1020326.1 amidohydrolase [Sutcliffiella horikoshii]